MIKVVNKKTFKRPKGHNIVIPIHRPYPLGNPFPLNDVNDNMERDNVIAKYREWLWAQVVKRNMVIVKALGEIVEACEKYKDVFLMCFCAPKKCHGEEIITILGSVPLNAALDTGGPPRPAVLKVKGKNGKDIFFVS